MKKPKEITVEIQRIVPGGFGLAFAENLTVFVPLAARGDRLRVEINKTKGKIAFAEIVEIIEPSPERVEAPCVYFGACGGCDFQQMPYQIQLDAKVEIIRDCLRRIGKIDFPEKINVIPSPKPLRYRARAQWHLDTRSRKFGYFRRNSHEVIDVKTCPILTTELQKTLTDLRENILWENFWSNKVEIEAASAGEKVSVYSSEIVEPTEEINFMVGGEKYFYSSKSFFQGNPFLIESLLKTALENASGETALDLYCGVGLFTLPLARKFTNVKGVEAFPEAIDFAEKSMENARLENIEFHRESVDDFLAENRLENVDFVLLDPPRAGAEKSVIENIIRIRPSEISYVSCEPSVLARDLRIFMDNGYQIEKITALDLFPQTHHVETVVRLKL